ncbi:GLPGLI family protein [Flavobacterium chuncheonense]|uniref:GLPGLI family protein n=1 Tax=Flavobacterium chuncheonense TaxID=2026653 RepID=A0ABW5YP76_9FLAO
MQKRLLALLLLSISFLVQSQNYSIIYGKMNSFSNDDLNKITDVNIKNNVINTMNSFKFLEYELIINYSCARFNYIEKLDSPNINPRAISAGGGSGIHFFDLNKNLTIHKTELLGDTYFVEKKIDSYKWNITNESKEINGFICYKAEADFPFDDFRGKGVIELVAWFCPQFPYPFGPDIYFGLPGLVFEAYKKNTAVKFYLKKIKQLDEVNKIDFPKEEKISEEEMTKIFNKTMNDLINQN